MNAMTKEDYELLVSVLIEARSRFLLEASMMKTDRPTFAADILTKADRLQNIRLKVDEAWEKSQLMVDG